MRQETNRQEGVDGQAQAISELNALPKSDGAVMPWGDVHFVAGHGGWWAECPTTGRGYWYPTVEEAVCSWLVEVVRKEGNVLVARPRGCSDEQAGAEKLNAIALQ